MSRQRWCQVFSDWLVVIYPKTVPEQSRVLIRACYEARFYDTGSTMARSFSENLIFILKLWWQAGVKLKDENPSNPKLSISSTTGNKKEKRLSNKSSSIKDKLLNMLVKKHHQIQNNKKNEKVKVREGWCLVGPYPCIRWCRLKSEFWESEHICSGYRGDLNI